MARKTAPLKNADLTPQPLYASGKPAVPAALQTAPRDNGGMADGKTGGNFDNSYMGKIGINNAGVAEAAAESAQEQFEGNAQ